MDFDGLDNRLSTFAAWTAITNPTIVAVFRQETASSGTSQAICDGAEVNDRCMILVQGSSNKIGFLQGPTVVASGQTPVVNTDYWMIADFQGDANSNGELSTGETWSGDAGNQTLTGLLIGGGQTSPTSVPFPGLVYEIIVFDSGGALAADLRTTIKAYLLEKYGI